MAIFPGRILNKQVLPGKVDQFGHTGFPFCQDFQDYQTFRAPQYLERSAIPGCFHHLPPAYLLIAKSLPACFKSNKRKGG
jgi:hypothetical protein